MKVKQLRNVLDEAARQREAAGEVDAARTLTQLANLAKKHDAKTVTAFAKLVKANC